jgi:hypothetical protein
MASPATARLGNGLRASVEAVRSLVAALHAGQLPSNYVVFSSARATYWSPSFIQGRMPEVGAKPFTALSLSLMLGNATRSYRSHDIVRSALLLLELEELGEVDAEDLEFFFSSTNLTQRMLLKVFTKTRTAHYADEAAQQLLATSQQ